MSFYERIEWVIFVTTALVFGFYAAVLARLAAGGQAAPDTYWLLFWIAIGLYVVLVIAGAVAASVWTKLRDGGIDDTLDERDTWYKLVSDRAGNYTQGVLLMGLLGMIVLGLPHILLANGVLAVMVVATLAQFGTKIWLYRRDR